MQGKIFNFGWIIVCTFAVSIQPALNVDAGDSSRPAGLDISVGPSCDSDAYRTRKLQINPSFTTVFGQIPIAITGPCFNESYIASCVFQDGDKRFEVPATIVMRHKNPKAICTVPYLYTLGRINIELHLKFGDLTENYTGYIYATQMEEDVHVQTRALADGKILVNLTWNSKFFPKNQSLDLIMLEYDIDKNEWMERGVFGKHISNRGFSQLVIADQNISSFAIFSLRISTLVHHRSKRGLIDQLRKLAASGPIMPFLVGPFKIFSGQACQEWYEKDPGVPNDPGILHCPPKLDQAVRDFRYTKVLPFDLVARTMGKKINYFQQRTPTKSGAGQLCAYMDGNLYTTPPLGGHLFRYSPNTFNPKNAYGFYTHEVLPHDIYCCFLHSTPEDCQKYYDKRPSDPGTDYVPPNAALARGPHIATFDTASYTFNGVGEFWMIKNTNASNFEMQARMERTTLASVFTAFVMHETGTSVQVQLSSSSNGIDVMLDGQTIDLGSDRKERIVPTEKATIIVSDDRNEVRVSFASGFSFLFTRVENAMTLWSVADINNKGKTWGLLGNNDENPENDLQTPDNTVIPISSSLETIFSQFGSKWMISKDESFFTYGHGESYDFYKNPNLAQSVR